MLVSVIVPCRNEARHIENFLDDLLRQETAGFELEILIADGMSDDGTREKLAASMERDARIRVIDNPAGIVSTGLNAAIRASRGETVLRMDVHSKYAPDYIRQCLEVLDETGAGNVGGAARTNPKGLKQRAVAAAYGSAYSTGGASFHDETYEGYSDTVPYGCWRRSTLERIGLFDEELVRNQDDELNLRLIRMGGAVWQSRRIVSCYQPRSLFSSLFRQYFQYGFWKVAVIRKHRLPASWRHLVPGAFVLANVLLPLAALVAWTAGSPLARMAAWAWFIELGLYCVATLLASAAAASRRGWALLPILPAVFATYHVSYGSGFLAGLAYFPLRRSGAGLPGKAFTSISR